jgi:ABC-2 type transport system permease protein
VIAWKLFAVAKKDFLNAARSRSGFAFTALAQAAQLATFYYLARAVGPKFRPEGMPYFLFLLVGTGFYAFLLTGIHKFLRTVQDAQQTGMLEVLMTSSTSEPLLLALEASSAFGEGLLQLVLYFTLALWFFAAILHINLAACVALFLFSTLTAFALGLFAAGLQIYMQKGSAVLWLIGSGAWLMSGTLFPVAALPRTARVVSFCIPFTHSLSGMRMALLGGNAALVGREVLILAIFALVLVPAGVMFFSWTVRQARQNGTLSFY